MKKFIRFTSLLLVALMLIVFSGSAYANGIEPKDGFSWSHSYNNPSGGGGYGDYGSWTNKSTALDAALSNLSVTVL